MKYQCVIFDWDGTLMDSAPKIVACMGYAARKNGLPVPSYKAGCSVIGLSLKPALCKLFGVDEEDLLNQLVADYREGYLYIDKTPTPLFSHVDEVLRTLANKTELAVATGKNRAGLDRMIKEFAFESVFTHTRTADEALSKPSPDMLEQIILAGGYNVSQCLFVGDTVFDMQMAEVLGMDRLAVSFGAHTPLELNTHSPVAIIDDFREMFAYVC